MDAEVILEEYAEEEYAEEMEEEDWLLPGRKVRINYGSSGWRISPRVFTSTASLDKHQQVGYILQVKAR